MKKIINAEVIERRGRVTRIKLDDGIIGSIPLNDIPIGTKILITVEDQICSFDKNKIWPSAETSR